MANKTNSKSSQKKRHPYLWIFLATCLVGVTALLIYVIEGLPSLEELENPKAQLASKVYSIDGELIGQFFIENRIETDIDSLPQHLLDALIDTEDRKFYSHWGVDVDRFIKAMVKNIFTFSREGASTITQQLAKNLYGLKTLGESDFATVIRKIREWFTAVQIERNYTKREILELYLNISYFGKSAYGIETAANIYFGKKAKELQVHESALLVALLKSSVFYDPEKRENSALQRRNLVLFNMYEQGHLTKEEYENAVNEPIILSHGKTIKIISEAPHFIEYVRQQMTPIAERNGYDLYRDGLNIFTTLDIRMQRIANKVASEHLKEYQEIFNKNFKWENNKTALNALVDKAIKTSDYYKSLQTEGEKISYFNKMKHSQSFIDSVKKVEETIQIGFVAIEPRTGQIKAMIGGENQEFLYGLNHVTQIRRQPGSSFKPIVYTVAVENGFYPAHTLLNQKFEFEGWSPSNSDNSYSGYMTFREALAKSVNVIAARITTFGIAPPAEVIKYARKMGITSPLSPYPSMALGTFELSPLELTNAIATIAGGGIYTAPISILRIEDKNGILVEEFVPESREVVSQETAFIVTSMMEDVLSYGTGARARQWFQRPAAGKTGTTQDFADAWFVGFTPQLVAGVWVGFDDRRVRFNGWYGQGARAAMPVWAKFMAEVYKELNIPLQYFEKPPDVVSMAFCKQSMDAGDARLAGDSCPNKVYDFVNKNKLPPNCYIHGSGPARGNGSSW